MAKVEGVDSPYWQTSRARSTFGPWVVGPDTETDVVACIEARIARLRDGFLQASGWRGVVHGSKENHECLTDHDIHWLQLKCRHIAVALEVALEKMPVSTWEECCAIALERIRQVDGLVHVKRVRTIMDWHRKFRVLGDQFANPAIVREGGRPSLPPFFEKNPEAKEIILKHTRENLPLVSFEYIYSFCRDQLLP